MGIATTVISLSIIHGFVLATPFDSWQTIVVSIGGTLVFILGVLNPIQHLFESRAKQRKAQVETALPSSRSGRSSGALTIASHN
jgi:hypothetical protein